MYLINIMDRSSAYRITLLAVVILSSLSQIHSFKLTPHHGTNSLGSDVSERNSLVFKERLIDEITRVEVGQSVVLECEAGGQPVPTIHWLHNGNRLPQGRSHSVLDDEAYYEQTARNDAMQMLQLGNTRGRLVIDCVTSDHAGTYTCVAQTPTERIASQTYLEVDGATRDCPSVTPQTGIAAYIYMWENQRLEFEGADVQLFCRADGFPHLRRTWYDRNGHAITKDNPEYKLLKNGDLLIRNINWFEHMGLFRCHVTNSFGEDETQVFVYPTQP